MKINAGQYKLLIDNLNFLAHARHSDFKGVYERLDKLEKQQDKVPIVLLVLADMQKKLDAIQGALLLKDFENHQASGGKSKTRRTVPVNLTPSRPRKLQVTK